MQVLSIALGSLAGALIVGYYVDLAWSISHPPPEIDPAAGLTAEDDEAYYAAL